MSAIATTEKLTFAVAPAGPEIIPLSQVKRFVFWDNTGHSEQPLAQQLGLQITELVHVGGALIPLSIHTKNTLANATNPSWQVDGRPVSPIDVYKIITKNSSAEVPDPKIMEKFIIGITELNLPPLVASFLAGREDLSLEQMKADYQPSSPDDFTAIVGVTGPSRSGESQFFAIEMFRQIISGKTPDFAVIGCEPFGDYGFNNYLQCLLNMHHSRDISSMDDTELLKVIKYGMEEMVEHELLPSPQTDVSVILQDMANLFKTGVNRPKVVYFDLNGYTPENPREPHQFDLLTMFATDEIMIMARGFETNVNNQWVPADVDKRSIDIDAKVIAQYHQQLAENQDNIFKSAWNTHGTFINRVR